MRANQIAGITSNWEIDETKMKQVKTKMKKKSRGAPWPFVEI